MAKPLIYVIEDDQVFSRILGKHLEHNSYTNIEYFTSGEQCLEKIEVSGEKPSFIFLDFSLERMNGLDTLKKIRTLSKKIKVIIITSLVDENVKQLCLDNGALLYINKTEVVEDLPRSVIGRLKKRSFFGF